MSSQQWPNHWFPWSKQKKGNMSCVECRQSHTHIYTCLHTYIHTNIHIYIHKNIFDWTWISFDWKSLYRFRVNERQRRWYIYSDNNKKTNKKACCRASRPRGRRSVLLTTIQSDAASCLWGINKGFVQKLRYKAWLQLCLLPHHHIEWKPIMHTTQSVKWIHFQSKRNRFKPEIIGFVYWYRW